MAKKNRERVLEWLQYIAPRGATNSQIRESTAVSPHSQVYMLTQELMRKRLIRGQRHGNAWKFYVGEVPVTHQTTNRELVLNYIRSIETEGATNSQICEATKISPHSQVYQITQALMRKGIIRGVLQGREWVFYAGDIPENQQSAKDISLADKTDYAIEGLSPKEFERLAQRVMSVYLGIDLIPGDVPGIPKRFDFVSADQQIVGDAKYYTLVRGHRLPPAKFSVIAEHVWLLEKSKVRKRFLVFGNDIEVPRLWLARYGTLVNQVSFFFLTDEGKVQLLL